eukprot:749586-Hanusia_phi.AAC.1
MLLIWWARYVAPVHLAQWCASSGKMAVPHWVLHLGSPAPGYSSQQSDLDLVDLYVAAEKHARYAKDSFLWRAESHLHWCIAAGLAACLSFLDI